MLRRRTQADNRQLTEGEVQFESLQGAVSARLWPADFRPDFPPCVEVCCVRGIQGRQAQVAILDGEALDAFITYLQDLRSKLP